MIDDLDLAWVYLTELCDWRVHHRRRPIVMRDVAHERLVRDWDRGYQKIQWRADPTRRQRQPAYRQAWRKKQKGRGMCRECGVGMVGKNRRGKPALCCRACLDKSAAKRMERYYARKSEHAEARP